MSAFEPVHSQLFVNDFTFTAEDLTPGLLYHFRVTATNRIGESLPSEETGYYAAAVPVKPAPLQKGLMSSRSRIELSWPVQLDGDVPLAGYVLECDLGQNQVFSELLDARNAPDTRIFLFEEVEQGRFYDFRYKAINLNNQQTYSDILRVYTCENPSSPGSPTWITSSESSIWLSFELSADDGGCPIQHYTLYRDGEEIRQLQPYESRVEVTQFPPDTVLGEFFQFHVSAHTEYGQAISEQSEPMILAGKPDRPSAAPQRNGLTSTNAVAVDIV